jgi:hypothetical protein
MFGAFAKGNLLPFGLLGGARFKNFVTIRDSYTQQGLSYLITFRPIKSGATGTFKAIYTASKLHNR